MTAKAPSMRLARRTPTPFGFWPREASARKLREIGKFSDISSRRT